MAFEIDDLVDNMHGALRFFLAHLDGLKADQWDWKPAPACRSIREMLLHLSETYEDKAALEKALARPVPDVSEVQRLFEAAAKQDYARLRRKYADTPQIRRHAAGRRGRRHGRRLVPGASVCQGGDPARAPRLGGVLPHGPGRLHPPRDRPRMGPGGCVRLSATCIGADIAFAGTEMRETPMKAIWNNTVLAESDQTVVVEGNHYFPAESVKQDYMKPSATHSTCPWKGVASYYTVEAGGKTNPDAAWYYPEPNPGAEQVKDRVAFWKGVQVG